MNEIEQRLVIEDLHRYEQTVRSTSVRKGEVCAWISTIEVSPDKSYGCIETATFRTRGIKKLGREGIAVQHHDYGLVPLLDFSCQFPFSERDAALNFHAETVERIAEILEENPSLLETIERIQLDENI